MLLGIPPDPVPVDIADLVLREIRLVGNMSHLADLDLAPALAYLDGNAEHAGRIVTARVPLERTVRDGIDVLVGPDAARHAKMLVRVAGA